MEAESREYGIGEQRNSEAESRGTPNRRAENLCPEKQKVCEPERLIPGRKIQEETAW